MLRLMTSHGPLIASWLILGMVLGACQAPSEPGRRQAQPIQPAAGSGSGTRAAKPPPTTPTEPAATHTSPVADGSSFCQVILVSEPSPAEAPPGLKYIRLQRGTARAVGEALAVLCVPAGASGVQDRYSLLYPTAAECKAAASWSATLDAEPLEAATATAPAGGAALLRWGLGLLYTTSRSHQQEADRLRSVAAALERAAADTDAAAPLRWAAAMIAGDIWSERLYIQARAEQQFEAAQELVPRGSLERIATLYARAGAWIQDGRPDDARRLLKEAIIECGAFADSEVCQRVKRTLEEIERKRR